MNDEVMSPNSRKLLDFALAALELSTWVPVTVRCPNGCIIGEVHETPNGAVWNPRREGVDRVLEFGQVSQAQARQDGRRSAAVTVIVCDPRVLNSGESENRHYGACRKDGTFFVTEAEALDAFTQATRPPRHRTKLIAHPAPNPRQWKTASRKADTR